MPYQHEVLRQRTRTFAIRVFKLCQSLQSDDPSRMIARQLLRSATSVAANYRAAGRARSKAEFISKMGVVVEEADETLFWIEFIVDTEILSAERMTALIQEANELLAIFAASQHTARQRNR